MSVQGLPEVIRVHMTNVDEIRCTQPIQGVLRRLVEKPPASSECRTHQPGIEHEQLLTQLQLHAGMGQVRHLWITWRSNYTCPGFRMVKVIYYPFTVQFQKLTVDETYFNFSFLELLGLSRVSEPGVDGAQFKQLKPPFLQNHYLCIWNNRNIQSNQSKIYVFSGKWWNQPRKGYKSQQNFTMLNTTFCSVFHRMITWKLWAPHYREIFGIYNLWFYIVLLRPDVHIYGHYFFASQTHET